MTTAEIIRNRMNRAMSSKGKTFIWNPRSKFHVKRKIKDELESKYTKRIEYLVGANNELCHELEKCEQEKRRYASMADSIKLDDNY